jgi:hypothetical protein
MWRHVGRRWLPTTNKAWRSLPASMLVAQHRLDGLVRGRADGMTSRWVRDGSGQSAGTRRSARP